MTDRVVSLQVTLDADYRIDDVQTLVDAILCMRGVADVSPDVKEPTFWAAYIRAKTELERTLLNALRSPKGE